MVVDRTHARAAPASREDPDPVRRAIRRGLSSTPKMLPPILFYDAKGSELFEAITALPEYYPTRTERAILQAHADEIVEAARKERKLEIVELGAGSSAKTRVLLRALVQRQGATSFVPVDVSPGTMLAEVPKLEAEIPGVRVRPLVAENEAALRQLPASKDARLFLFLGSSIGNYDPAEAARFLSHVRKAMRPEDRLLLGTDMVKDVDVLHAAYNDAAGVTAAFNLNVLARLNREFDGTFDLARFEHRAFYNEGDQRIEMHLVSASPQEAQLRALGLTVAFEEGESIHTENSHKYTLPDVDALAHRAGLRIDRTWADREGWFTLHLLERGSR